MWFHNVVTGPLDLGAMMCAFCEVYDEGGALNTPADAIVRVKADESDWPGVVLNVGSKGAGRCEFAPLMGRDARYLFRLELAGEPASDWAVCDLALPFVDKADQAGGQLHKSFYVRFYPGSGPTPPPPPADWQTVVAAVATDLEQEAARLRALLAS